MPEYPEIKIIADQITNLVENSQLLQFKIVGSLPTIIRSRAASINRIIARGNRIFLEKAVPRGKIIYIKFKIGYSNRYIVSHLMLNGQWRTEKQKFSTFGIEFWKDNVKQLWFGDSMRLGKIELLTQLEFNLKILKMGIDIDKLTLESFGNIAKKSSQKIMDLLIDQSRIAGIGNYMRSEILYRSKIDPRKKSNTLNAREINRLFRSIMFIADNSYARRGSSGKYVDIYGNTGSYRMKVYEKNIDSRGHKIEILLNHGRKIFWVPVMQK